jgi:hypothetical protein
MSNSPNVQRDFNVGQPGAIGPPSAPLGLVTLSGGSSPDGAKHTFSVSATADFVARSNDLFVGFLSPTSSGKGFDTLTFTITANDSTVLQRVTFNSMVVADAYFTDDSIDLGPSGTIQSLAFSFVLTSTAPTDSYAVNFIYGNSTANAGVTPEPSTAMLMIVGGSALLLRRRRSHAQ